jgi:mRNA interferase YafQ
VLRRIKTTNQFEKDVRKLSRRGRYELGKLHRAMSLLEETGQLPEQYGDHKMHGQGALRNCHIEHDWVLLYMMDEQYVTFVRTGTHADLGLD